MISQTITYCTFKKALTVGCYSVLTENKHSFQKIFFVKSLENFLTIQFTMIWERFLLIFTFLLVFRFREQYPDPEEYIDLDIRLEIYTNYNMKEN